MKHKDRKNRLPPKTLILTPSVFADRWSKKPTSDVLVGLRLLSESDMQTARAEADAWSWEMHPKPEQKEARVDCFNDALVRWAVGKCVCDPGDITKSFFENAESTVRDALTSEGARFIFNQLDLLSIEVSPIVPMIEDKDALALGALLSSAKWCAKPGKEASIRRYLAAAWELIERG